MVKALADLNKAIELDPTNAVAYNNRGSLFDDIREFQLALKDLNTAIELSPEYGNAYYNRGVIFENLGER
jgi:tetratricopeptide (TPR) repeat protein